MAINEITKAYRTKTEIITTKHVSSDKAWEIAIDIGYSGVKLFAPNIEASFPSYARKIDRFEAVSDIADETILYKDLDNGQLWIVGKIAQDMIERGDTSDSEAALFGRDRYGSEIFKVISRVGLALGTRDNNFGHPGNKIVIQTGLPERYLKEDEPLIKDVFSGRHHFAIRVGNGEWETRDLNISYDDVYVMSQPKGALLSLCIDKDGKWVSNAEEYMNSNLLVFDPGFGTLDVFRISNGMVCGVGETFQNLGMKRVMQETIKAVELKYGVHLTVPEIQKHLESGKVKYFDRKNLISKEYDFSQLLSEASRKVCDEAIKELLGSVSIIDCKYMIVTGGTGAAWLDQIRQKFGEMDTLKVLSANVNDELSLIYSNVRGYYFFRYGMLQI